jgi:hypothetical protein
MDSSVSALGRLEDDPPYFAEFPHMSLDRHALSPRGCRWCAVPFRCACP